jgi:hypothetical protein
MTLTIVAGLVIVFLIFLGLFVTIDLAVLPGRIARKRGHPQADAVSVAGIVGLFTVLVWPVALAWAYYRPSDGGQPPAGQEGELEARIALLEAQLGRADAGCGEPTT